jgi:hypothetical protein
MEKNSIEYAEMVCNGQFPITYTREQVVSHTAGDFNAGVEAYRNHILGVLQENLDAAKRGLVEEDKVRPAEELLIETYEDLISIFSKRSS